MIQSIADLIRRAKDSHLSIGRLVIEDEILESGKSEEEIWARMLASWRVMEEGARLGLQGVKSKSGLVGGGAKLLEEARLGGKTITNLLAAALARSVAVAEVNASLGRIVAAPTAGAAGVLPGVFLAVYHEKKVPEEKIIEALFAAGGIGQAVAARATIAGAAGGCQAETGVASAMAAGALVELFGGNPDQVASAVAITITNHLGLVCDPIAGLVEVPCVKRNAAATANAFAAAELALAGVMSVIPADEVIDTMSEIGHLMPTSLRETAQGGLAATPTGKRIAAKLRQELHLRQTD